jgi:hypothetical protein
MGNRHRWWRRRGLLLFTRTATGQAERHQRRGHGGKARENRQTDEMERKMRGSFDHSSQPRKKQHATPSETIQMRFAIALGSSGKLACSTANACRGKMVTRGNPRNHL